MAGYSHLALYMAGYSHLALYMARYGPTLAPWPDMAYFSSMALYIAPRAPYIAPRAPYIAHRVHIPASRHILGSEVEGPEMSLFDPTLELRHPGPVLDDLASIRHHDDP